MRSDFPTVIGPVEQCLPLSRATGLITGLAVASDLRHVAANGLPLHPLPAFAAPCSSGNTTGTTRADRRDESKPFCATLIRAGWHSRQNQRAVATLWRQLGSAEPISWKCLSRVGHVLPTKHPERQHFLCRQLGAELGMEVTAPRSYERIPIAALHAIADGNNLPLRSGFSHSLAGRTSRTFPSVISQPANVVAGIGR